jgi:hypothetical protein
MRNAILVLALLSASSSSFGQAGNNEPLGGKTSGSAAAPAKKTSVPKPVPKRDKEVVSPCAVYNKIGSNAEEKWFSLGESANKHFWYNPHRTTCDAKTAVLKSWIKEEHKNTDGDFALVLYEFRCKPNQLRVKTVIEYDKTGGVLDTTNQESDTWQDVAPGTAGETMMRTVCRRQ